ncbi:MAG: zinc ribbon domain-containing protein [Sedimentisphaerales bacterium]|nr:zinc ribbon domain-containing protein [Sedimentisphaerales bacterium]
MPIYQYKSIGKGCEYCSKGFEQMQSMKDKPLTKCPKCSGKVKKVPALFSGYSPLLSDSNLRDKGFTKLVKKDKGTYEKTT